ncbi:MAG TPA: hypothetical protein VMS55_12090 [Myxococcota bacterium]|nr:hypothetical protein [Myxococcota bacterium]
MKRAITPFYAGGDAGPRPRGRILLLSYHFPPAQTAGALRWQKLARFAHERGYGLDVLTLAPAALSMKDEASLADLPATVRVYAVSDPPTALDHAERLASRALHALRRLRPKAAASAPASSARPAPLVAKSSYARSELRFEAGSLASWSRAYHSVAMPTKEKGWALRAASRAQDLFVPGEHRMVVACGPPHMTFEGARRLSRRCGIPLVLDFRDAWSFAERLPAAFASPLWPRLVGYYEARAVRQASLVVMNTELACRAMQAHYPAAAARVLAVPNGCDEGTVARAFEPGGPFRIAYAGSIYLDRSPGTLFRALARVVRELGLAPGEIEVAFMGAVAEVDGVSLESEAAAAGVGPYFRQLPLGTRKQAERFLASAHVLLNLHQDTHMAIPSKVFEYMRHEAALLALATPDSATYHLLEGTRAAVAAPDDVDAIAAAIRRLFDAHRRGIVPAALAGDPRFSRRHQAERLFDALERLDAGAQQPTSR